MARESSRSRSPRINMYVESSCIVMNPPMPNRQHHARDTNDDDQTQRPFVPKHRPQIQRTNNMAPPWNDSMDNKQGQIPVSPKIQPKPKTNSAAGIPASWTDPTEAYIPVTVLRFNEIYIWKNWRYPVGYYWTWHEWTQRYWTQCDKGIWWTPYIHFDKNDQDYTYWHSSKHWYECMQE